MHQYYRFYSKKKKQDELNKIIYRIVPDYVNIETTNRISTNNGTWTVDRNGYVVVYAYGTGTSGGGIYFYINNIQYIGTGAMGPVDFQQIFIVSKGDVIKIIVQNSKTFNNCSCKFIPMKLEKYSIHDDINFTNPELLQI